MANTDLSVIDGYEVKFRRVGTSIFVDVLDTLNLSIVESTEFTNAVPGAPIPEELNIYSRSRLAAIITGSTSGAVGVGAVGVATGRTILVSSTLALTDANTRISCNHATVPVVCTIPNDATVAWPNEALICLYQGLAAACSFAAGAGVTIHALDTSVQYGVLTALKTGANEWTVQK